MASSVLIVFYVLYALLQAIFAIRSNDTISYDSGNVGVLIIVMAIIAPVISAYLLIIGIGKFFRWTVTVGRR